MPFRPLVPVGACLALGAFAPLAAQAPATTRDGVFTARQAALGKDLYAGACQSCHQAIAHTGPPFQRNWEGRTLAELYAYIRDNMPKNDPGTLSDEENAVAMAYILQMNGMPAGTTPLVPDEARLRRVRIELGAAKAPSAPRR